MKTLFFYFVHSSKKPPYFATNRLFFYKAVYFCTNFFREILAKSIFEGKKFAGNLFILKESLFSYFNLSFLSKSEKKTLTVHFI